MEGYKSFLGARDPSIVAWGGPLNPTNLCNQFSSNSTTISQDSKAEYLEVCLRVKPSAQINELYDISDNVLTCHVPVGSHILRNLQNGDKVMKNFTFTKIYGPKVSQSELFNDCMKLKVLNFINGRNCTFFTYGTSGSGKTYTILGTSENPGIIPRSLEYVFKTLPMISKNPSIKVCNSGEAKPLNDEEIKMEIQTKNAILNNASLNERAEQIETYKLMQQRLSSEPSATLTNDCKVFVEMWVSFAEVYNEYVYDLLIPAQGMNAQRPKLRLAQDSKGNTYIKDLKSIYVSSGAEAYQVLQYGMQNVNYASTNINSHSSRSHCIFTIKLIQYISNSEVQVSHFNFCDLAGSERVKLTHNIGVRLKESNNINTSLHVLGRCIKAIRKHQKTNDSHIIPFRDSKLTRLFQHALSGEESVTMLVNISTSQDMFDDSLHVLNFSAIARDINIIKEVKPEKINVNKKLAQYAKNQSTALPSRKFSSENDMLRQKIQSLTLELDNMKSMRTEQDNLIRREVMETYRNKIEEINDKWKNRMDEFKKYNDQRWEIKLKQAVDYYEETINQQVKRPRLEVINIDDSDDECQLEDLKSKYKNATEEINHLSDENKKLLSEMSKLKFENAALANNLACETDKISKLNQELLVLREKLFAKDNLIEDARIELEELDKEKQELEGRIRILQIEVIKQNGIISELNNQNMIPNDMLDDIENGEEQKTSF